MERPIALNEMSYRRLLWSHRPLTDFWRVGPGYAKKLEAQGLFTMGDIARCSIGRETDYYSEQLLYQLFGVNAELLIDHAWGWEPCTISDIKAYKPSSNSIGAGQVLQCPYSFEKARLIVWEMADLLALELVEKGLVTDQLVLTVGYDRESLATKRNGSNYTGPTTTDRYGRVVPKHAHGTANLTRQTSSAKLILDAVMQLYDRIVNKTLLVRRVTMAANRVVNEQDALQNQTYEQMDLFTNLAEQERKRKEDADALEREKKMQQTIIAIKKRYGKNAILKGANFLDGATTKDRNRQFGGHKA